MMQEISHKSKRYILIGAWILIGLQFMALMGLVTDGQQRESAMGAFMLKYTAATTAVMVGAFDYFVGINIFPIAAMVAGWILWKRYKCSQGSAIIGTGAVAIIVGSALIFS